jgi:hypothetical protein
MRQPWQFALAVLLFVAAVRPTVLAQQPSGTGVVRGVVTNESGTRNLGSAYVVLIGTTTGVLKVTSSDRDGRFEFGGLPADRYTVGASKPPYLGAIAGAKRPGRPGVPVALAPGQQINDLAIRLPMGGAISGVIAGEDGRPAANTYTLLHQWKLQGTERALVQAGAVTTDDLGAYRFSGLVPGEYLVSATRIGTPFSGRPLSASEVDAALKGAAPSGPSLSTQPMERSSAIAAVFFPGTPRASDAQVVSIATGEDRRGIDFRIEAVRSARIEGNVVIAGAQPPPNLMVFVRSSAGGIAFGSSVRVTPDGRFSVPGVPPGSYLLSVNGTGPLAGQFAAAQVEVAGADISGVQLTMRPALSFSGTLAFQGTSMAPSLAGRRVPVRALTASATGGSPQSSVTDNTGRFTVTNVVPGRFVMGGSLGLGPTSDTMNWVLQSVRIDGRDATDLPIDIADAPPKDVIVIYGDQWQELSGRIQSATGAAISDVTIVVFPEDKAYWFQGSRRIVAARPDTDGRFTASGRGPATLPAGRYLLAMVVDLARDEQFDPAFLSAIVPGAIPIVLQPGERKVQDLTLK